RYGFGQLTDVIIYSHEAGISKPDPRIYRLACDRLGVRPEEMIFLDDVAANVAAARDPRAPGSLFPGPAHAIPDIHASLAPQPAACLPVSAAARSCSRMTVGSSPNRSSPTSASAMARRIAAVGLVTVSERKSMYRLPLMVLPCPWFAVCGPSRCRPASPR